LKAQAARAGRALSLRAGLGDGRRLAGVVAVVPYYGDEHLLPWFLGYYRRLGIGFFVFLDESPAGDLATRLAETADCAVWRADPGTAPVDTLHALNYLRHLYAERKWCLSVEPFDILVFAHSETRHIRDLIDFVETEHRMAVAAIVVDTYAAGAARELARREASAPHELLPFFDWLGYQTAAETAQGVMPVVGGVQRRALHAETPEEAPPLNRVPLVRLRPEYYYIESTAVMNQPALNAAHAGWHTSPTACLLRYALLSHAAVQNVPAETAPGDLLQNSIAMAEMNLKTSTSAAWRGSQDLVARGLINNGQWF
jgi:hypothetical protein